MSITVTKWSQLLSSFVAYGTWLNSYMFATASLL